MSAFDEWIDSLPAPPSTQPHVVYIAWSDALPLYVGMTGDLERRIRAHASSSASKWTEDCTHVEFVEVRDRIAAERLELQVIRDLLPTGNRWVPKPHVVEMTEAELQVADREAADLLSSAWRATQERAA